MTRSTTTRTSSTCTSRTCVPRSAAARCRRCVASATGSPTGMSLRLRLTLAFALSVAVVLTGLAIFLYERLGVELQHGIDLALRSRAGAITSALDARGSIPINARGSVIDPDEAFAQVLDPDGRI